MVFAKIMKDELLNKEDAITLLNIPNGSDDFYRLLYISNNLTRSQFNNKGFIFAQIGINAEPCSVNCRFCSMGRSHYTVDSTWRKDIDTIMEEVKQLIDQKIDDLFIMTTADYPISDFINIGKRIRKILPSSIRLVANIGDFNYSTAVRLKEAGFTGAYHINRLREGIDTNVSPDIRINTLDAIRDAGLELYYCVEPIGPEHTYEELATEMLRAREYNVGVMAVMRRIPVKNTPLYQYGQISAVELTKIAAVTRIVSIPHRAMNAHEPIQMSLIGGVNQLYAELGANPRDDKSNTEKNRGFTVPIIRQMLADADYLVTPHSP